MKGGNIVLGDNNIIRPWKPSLLSRIVQNIRKISAKVFRKSKVRKLNNSIVDKDFTIISQFCVGGVIYHDLKMQFLSPTINLAFDGPDFVKFCFDFEKYLKAELVEVQTNEVPYPVGRLEDVEIRFVHYKSFEEAKQKWVERSKRINFEKIIVIAHDRDGMNSEDCMAAFDKLPYEKVMYTSKKYEEYQWAKYCPTFRKKHCVGVMTGYADFWGNRYYEKYADGLDFLK